MMPKTGWQHTYEEYRALLALPLDEKISRATELITTELGQSKHPALACSWGKCSVTLLHLIRQICNRVLVLFCDTGVEYPEIYAYRDLLLEEWQITRYVETHPEKTFWQCVKEYGFPHIRSMYSDAPSRAGSPKCCKYLKEQPARKAYRQYDIDASFVGLQATESNLRCMSFLREGEAFNSKLYQVRVVRPLMIWTDADIWAYHQRHQIPHNPLYDKVERSGCMPCTGFRTWRQQLARTNPKLYRTISHRLGQNLLEDWECKQP